MHLKSKNYFGHLCISVQGYTDFHIFIKNPTATCVAVGSFIAAFRFNKTPG